MVASLKCIAPCGYPALLHDANRPEIVGEVAVVEDQGVVQASGFVCERNCLADRFTRKLAEDALSRFPAGV